ALPYYGLSTYLGNFILEKGYYCLAFRVFRKGKVIEVK
ncbi:unnamed protein product, partial [marine sediment metagenome]